MTYETSDGERTLAAPQRLHLSQAVAWMRQQRVQVGRPLLSSDWLDLTADHFNDFVDNLIQEDEAYDQVAPLPNHTNYTSTSNPALDFQKGIKRDVSQYTSFKEDRFWDVWHRDLLAKGRIHGISEVFDPAYLPVDDNAKALFAVQQAFAYSVFVTHIQTASGKNIVREYSKTGDAQSIYRRLLTRYTDSPEAKSNAQELKNKLALLRLDDTWRGTTSSFLNHWRSLNLQLDDMTPSCDLPTPSQRKSQLENAVAPHQELARVIQLERISVQKGDKALDYDQYLSLLDSTASDYDRAHQKPASRRAVNKANRKTKANQAKSTANAASSNKPATASTPTPGNNKRISLASEVWKTLTKETQQSIIAYNRSLKPPTRSANSTNTQPAPSATPPVSVVTTTAASTNTNTPAPSSMSIISGITNRDTPPAPLDMRSVLSSAQETSGGDTIQVNGRTYRSICSAKVSYSISKQRHNAYKKISHRWRSQRWPCRSRYTPH